MAVSSLDDQRPHWQAIAVCSTCGYKWVAVYPDAVKSKLECLLCGEFEGETTTEGRRIMIGNFKTRPQEVSEKRDQAMLSNLDFLMPEFKADDEGNVIRASIKNRKGEEVVFFTDTTQHRTYLKT